MTLDPELAGLTHHVGHASSISELLAEPTGQQSLEAFCGGLIPYEAPDVPARALEVPGPNGPVPIRIYGNAYDGGAPAVVWMHGGNFAVGGLDMRESDQLGREVAARSGGVVVSVGYRLALDGIHFPIPHEDVLAAWLWTVGHAAELGLDLSRLCLGGASAGGNLAVGAALYLKDAGLPLPAKLVLAYPFLHGELPEEREPVLPSMADIPPFLWFTEEDCRSMVENYIGGPLAMASSYAMPGHADPAGLPPSAVLSCEYDNLRFSAELFVERLRAAGIPVGYRMEPGTTHGFLNHSAALNVVQRGLQFLAEELRTTPPN